MKTYPDSPFAQHAKTRFERYALWRVEAGSRSKLGGWALCIFYTAAAAYFSHASEVRVVAWILAIMMWIILAETYVYSAILGIMKRQEELIRKEK